MATPHNPYVETQLWRDHQAYQAKKPGAVTNFRINNWALWANADGGRRFDAQLGSEHILHVLIMAKGFILNSLDLSPEKKVRDVTLYVESMDGVAHTRTDRRGIKEIHLSEEYVSRFAPGNPLALSYEMTGVLIHESTHVWQNKNGRYEDDPVYKGVIEGIADFIRLRAQYPGSNWVRRPGGHWFQGYSTTAYFFDWIDRKKVPPDLLTC